MRNAMAWGAAAMLAAAGCGSSARSEALKVADEHEGPPAVCEECKVTGGGTFFLDGDRWTFGLNAIPLGNGGVEGHIELQLHNDDDGTNIFGDVNEIVGCGRTEEHDLFGTFRGIERDSGLAFEVTVVDAGEPGRDDTITYSDSVSFGPIALEPGGNLQVHDLDRCAPPPPECETGFCICPDTGLCEPCPTDPPPTDPPFVPL